MLSPEEIRIRAAAELELRGRRESDRRSLTFRQFVDRVYPSYEWYRHCEVLGNVLQRVADGELRRLMVFMPPRHGKSQLATRLFPAYHLYRHPKKFIGINAYGSDLVYGFSRFARDSYWEIGGKTRNDSSAVKHWETPEGGGCWAAGIGGPITGKGFHLGIIDDPLKNAKESLSSTIRNGHKDWYDTTFSTREEPGGAIIIILTRWNEDDLAGWLLSRETSEEDPERWHIVNFPAVCEEDSYKFPDTCTVEPDWRSPGEVLCPERAPIEKLKRFQKNPYFWAAMFQQRPSPLEGDFFKRNWWQFYKQVPADFDQIIQSWDCAFKETSKSDFVVGQVWGKRGAQYYLLDQVRDRMDINGTLTAIRSLSAKYPLSSAKLVEDKANGSAVIDLLNREIAGLIPINPEGGKLVRAVAIAPYVQAGNVFLPDPAIAPWIHDYLEEFAKFPNGTHDDQVDSSSQALNWLETSQPGHWGVSEAGWSY